MAGRVEQVDVVIAPTKLHTRRKDRNPTLLFLGIIVGVGRAMIDSADAMFRTADIQHPFGDRSLASIDVRDDADVTNTRYASGHDFVGRWIWWGGDCQNTLHK